MTPTQAQLRVNLLVRLLARAAVVATSLAPAVIIAVVAYAGRSEHLERETAIQALVVSRAVARNPVGWRYATERLIEGIEDVRSRSSQTRIATLDGDLVATIGKEPGSWRLERSAPFHDFGLEAGRVIVAEPFGDALRDVAIALVLGLALAAALLYSLQRWVFKPLDSAEAQVRDLAFFDPLTRLPNRRLLADRLGRVLAARRRDGGLGAVLFIDLDNFKQINDTFGHQHGDLLLMEVSARLLAELRGMDTVGRIAGDEFVVLLEGLAPDPARAADLAGAVAERLRTALARPYVLANQTCHCTPSIGISLLNQPTDTIESVLKRADMAMYYAKGAGRNAVRFYDPAMHADVAERSLLQSTLGGALERGELRLHFQAQVNRERAVRGAEVLLRWDHPQLGSVPPAQFIPIAEDNGLIVPIGRWVIEASCAQLQLWARDPATRELELAVNVSAAQFAHPDFVDDVRSAIENTGIDGRLLKFELTETLAIREGSRTIEKIHELRRLGVGFALDDFGTGQSSLSLLTRLPLAQIKIDQSFVRHVAGSAAAGVMVVTIIDMARNLGMQAIAEGVETEQQFEFLDRHHCTAFQGYLFGRPVPIEEFELLLGKAPGSATILPFSRNA